jgi:hypothetical protein
LIQVIDNFLSDKNLLEYFFEKYISDGEIKYSFRNIGTLGESPHSFCTSRDMRDFHLPLIYDLYKKILTINDNSKYYIHRWRVNIHPTGFDGTIHWDYNDHNGPTYLYCCTPDWKPEWGGEFIVYDRNKEAKTATTFKEDRLIIFDGSLPHRAVAPTRLSSLLRVTLAFQCELVTE